MPGDRRIRTSSTSAPARLGRPGCSTPSPVTRRSTWRPARACTTSTSTSTTARSWYLDHFAARRLQPALGEISHSYLSSPEAPARMAALNPGMRLLVCLREPVDRAFSDYLDLVKNGAVRRAVRGGARDGSRGSSTVGATRRYLQALPRRCSRGNRCSCSSSMICAADPQAYADEVFGFLGVSSASSCLRRAEEPACPPAAHAARAGARRPSPPRSWPSAPACAVLRSRVKRSVRPPTGALPPLQGRPARPSTPHSRRSFVRRSPTRSVSSTALLDAPGLTALGIRDEPHR